jgi:hypothetical protein
MLFPLLTSHPSANIRTDSELPGLAWQQLLSPELPSMTGPLYKIQVFHKGNVTSLYTKEDVTKSLV